nr:MAG TPA: hypothetical protein [Caudoviricetes sp.]
MSHSHKFLLVKYLEQVNCYRMQMILRNIQNLYLSTLTTYQK